MRLSAVILAFVLIQLLGTGAAAQRRPAPVNKPKPSSVKGIEVGQSAVVVDETLSVLRKEPSLFSEPVHRAQRGRTVQIQGMKEADGVKFYKVVAPPTNFGWIQADAVFGKFRPGDEERFSKLVQVTDGFDQIEMATQFFEMYPVSKFKPATLLLVGDVLEEVAAKLSKDANNRLRRPEMAASAAPMHSYFLNFVSLDRYRKLGIIFLFNSDAKAFHYDGASWKEIVAKFPTSPEAAEAKKRLSNLATKMEQHLGVK
jgi:hypothetical protein